MLFLFGDALARESWHLFMRDSCLQAIIARRAVLSLIFRNGTKPIRRHKSLGFVNDQPPLLPWLEKTAFSFSISHLLGCQTDSE